jgi:hypothetical protein
MAKTLNVYLHSHFVGHLTQDNGGQMIFQYAESWLESPGASRQALWEAAKYGCFSGGTPSAGWLDASRRRRHINTSICPSVYACSSQQLESVGPLIAEKTRNAPQHAARLNRPRYLHTAHVNSVPSEVSQ